MENLTKLCNFVQDNSYYLSIRIEHSYIDEWSVLLFIRITEVSVISVVPKYSLLVQKSGHDLDKLCSFVYEKTVEWANTALNKEGKNDT